MGRFIGVLLSVLLVSGCVGSRSDRWFGFTQSFDDANSLDSADGFFTSDAWIEDVSTAEIIVQDAALQDSFIQDVDDADFLVQDVDDTDSLIQDVDDADSLIQDVDDADFLIQDVDDADSLVQDVDDADSLVQDVNDAESLIQDVGDESSMIDEAQVEIFVTDVGPDISSCINDTDCNKPDACLCTDSTLVCVTGQGICLQGECVYSTEITSCNYGCLNNACVEKQCTLFTDCDDSDPCTFDRCEANICVHDSIAGCCYNDDGCNDNDTCTIDTCLANECVFTVDPKICCKVDADCDDGDICTQDMCDFSTKSCVNTPIDNCCVTDMDCPDDGSLCTSDTCVDNQCHYDQFCTYGCIEASGECIQPQCTTDTECTSGVTCICSGNVSVCTTLTGSCVGFACEEQYQEEPCDGACVDGACVPPECYVPLDCDDGDSCTEDLCENFVCVFKPIQNCCHAGQGETECADQDPCTIDLCDNGICYNDAKCAVDCTPDGVCVDKACINNNDCGTDTVCRCQGQTKECLTYTGQCVANECVNSISSETVCPWGCFDGVCACTGPEDCEDNDPCTVNLCSSGMCKFIKNC